MKTYLQVVAVMTFTIAVLHGIGFVVTKNPIEAWAAATALALTAITTLALGSVQD